MYIIAETPKKDKITKRQKHKKTKTLLLYTTKIESLFDTNPEKNLKALSNIFFLMLLSTEYIEQE